MKLPRFLLGMALATALVAPAWAAEFTPAQRSEIESFIKDYLMGHPEVLKDALNELTRRETEAANAKTKEAIISQADAIYRSADDLVLGNPKGSVTVVEFFDYNCAYCRKALPEVQKLIEGDKDLRFVIKEFPILGPGSVVTAKAAIASKRQGKYVEFHQALVQMPGQKDDNSVLQAAHAVGLDLEQLKKDMEDESTIAILQRTYNLAESLGVNGTPSFLVDETLEPGYVPHDVLAKLIADVRESGGCKAC